MSSRQLLERQRLICYKFWSGCRPLGSPPPGTHCQAGGRAQGRRPPPRPGTDRRGHSGRRSPPASRWLRLTELPGLRGCQGQPEAVRPLHWRQPPGLPVCQCPRRGAGHSLALRPPLPRRGGAGPVSIGPGLGADDAARAGADSEVAAGPPAGPGTICYHHCGPAGNTGAVSAPGPAGTGRLGGAAGPSTGGCRSFTTERLGAPLPRSRSTSLSHGDSLNIPAAATATEPAGPGAGVVCGPLGRLGGDK